MRGTNGSARNKGVGVGLLPFPVSPHLAIPTDQFAGKAGTTEEAVTRSPGIGKVRSWGICLEVSHAGDRVTS